MPYYLLEARLYNIAQSVLSIQGKEYQTDDWTNVPAGTIDFLSRKLHLQPDHPIAITRQLIQSRFPSAKFTHYNDLNPVVSTYQNFDSLGFPSDHPGRSRTDTYYINSKTCLRTHTSAHQAETFQSNSTEGYTITADVYRRDAIDKSHHPVFHQMEGAWSWDRSKVPDGDIVAAVKADLAKIPKHSLVVEDDNPTSHPDRNPLQTSHSAEEVEVISAHLKRSIEDVVVAIFSHARTAAIASANPVIQEEAEKPLKVRWVEAYFPFTSPSWELEVFWQGQWLELLGSGVVKQELLNNARVPSRIGWAFGLGLERIAMILYSIPDIRLFWSTDKRFLSQFSASKPHSRFVPFSKYPNAPRDVAFWIKESASSAGGALPPANHGNDVMQIIRDVGGHLIEDVSMVDEFKDPKANRKSYCYRINYRSLERTIPRSEVNELHDVIQRQLIEKLGVEIR